MVKKLLFWGTSETAQDPVGDVTKIKDLLGEIKIRDADEPDFKENIKSRKKFYSWLESLVKIVLKFDENAFSRIKNSGNLFKVYPAIPEVQLKLVF